MAIQELVDPNSGAILFKKDKESKTIEDLRKKVKELEERLKILEDKIEKDSE